MKFGKFDVDGAAGAILAHSIQTPNGRMRKGIVIGADDIAALKSAGITLVTAALLEQGDIHENDAAQHFAQAICPDPQAVGLSLTAPFTGRVNMIADGPGVVQLDAARLIAANSVDPMISVATVPEFQQMTTGGLVATIKIISYGVPQAKLDEACDLARDSIRMSAPKLRSADLIISDTDGGVGDKGKEAIAARLDMLGVTLNSVQMVPHDAENIAAAITTSQADLVMILSGSATSDWADVAPTAVSQAGGNVHRFGMPVDPGNLLFLGSIGAKPVIGLPGCARSPALNGADWVLSRVVCGLDVTDADFAQMAIGGLLKEIPTRPQPRRPKSRTK
jgi:molybdenum cofactor cytidylyltransferase